MDVFGDAAPLQLVVVTAFSIALSAVVCLVVSQIRLTEKQKVLSDRAEPTLRELSVRVDVVPLETSRDTLQTHLRSLAGQAPDLRQAVITESLTVRSLAQKSDRFACATVTIRTSISGDKLTSRLQQVCEGFSYRIDCSFNGITPLSDGEKCDVVAVSGLASHPIGSWKTRHGNDMWLRDWLPEDIPDARVFLYGYDTTLLQITSKLSIEDLARSFLVSLTAFRRSHGTDCRPIIFIGHSLGGLLIKDALVQAYRGSNVYSQYGSLAAACRGLLLFGAPNQGLRNDSLIPIVNGQPNQALVDSIVVDQDSEPSEFLSRLSSDFAKCFQDRRLAIVCFYERRLSPTVKVQKNGNLERAGPLSLLVTRRSATTTGLVNNPDEDNIPVDADHSNLVKFESRGQDTYLIVKEKIRALMSNHNVPLAEQEQKHTTKHGKDITITQHGSTFSGSVSVNGGSFNQGNTVSFG